MIRLPRWFIVIIATLFVISPAVIGVINLIRVGWDLASFGALAIYLLVSLTSVLYYRQLKMPNALAITNLLSALIVPQLVNLNLEPSALGTPATWYVTAVATMLAISAVRQQRLVSWIGLVLLTVELLVWGGTQALFVSGLGGAIALVAAAHAISVGLENTSIQTASYLAKAQATAARTAADSAMRQERSDRITSTLNGTLPILETIARGELSDSIRVEARLLEAELRDEIRGRSLINTKLRNSVRAARGRGVEVVLLDEGGLANTNDSDSEVFRNRVAYELDQINTGKVTIRSPKEQNVRVTFVASRKGTAKPDVFLKL
jgi:hypothetical protein